MNDSNSILLKINQTLKHMPKQVLGKRLIEYLNNIAYVYAVGTEQ